MDEGRDRGMDGGGLWHCIKAATLSLYLLSYLHTTDVSAVLQVDQKPRPLPPAKTIQHSVKWNNEVDMAKLYFEREQKC